MRAVTFVQEHRPDVLARVRERYAAEMRTLASLGFRELCCYDELLGPYSLLTHGLRLLLMRIKREVLLRTPPLQAGAAFALMHAPAPDTIALPMGLGVKFYSQVTDGPVFVTTSFRSFAVPVDARIVSKVSAKGPLDEAWRAHAARVAAAGVARAASFEDFVRMAKQEEAALRTR